MRPVSVWTREFATGCRVLSAWLFLGVLLTPVVGLSADAGTDAGPDRNPRLDFNVPDDFFLRVRERAIIDEYEAGSHPVEAEIEPGVLPLAARHRPDERAVRVVRSEAADSVQRYRQGFARPVHPLRGFRAPILEDSKDLRLPTLAESGLTARQHQAANGIRTSLASEGLLLSLARGLEILGPEQFVTNGAAGTREFQDLGFPVDLLKFFPIDPAVTPEPGAVLVRVARQMLGGRSAEAIKPFLRTLAFHFRRTHPNFRAAEETGERAIGLLRLQIGGGYQNGIVAGGSLDVSGQLAVALPDADLLASVPAEYLENIRWMVLHCWLLHRPNRLTLIAESVPLSSWAQDDGKAGFLAAEEPGSGVLATLVPRYASQGEIDSTWVAGESFLMDGVRAAGHTVLHSPLLFQGGNLLVVRDPKRGERLLLLSETEVYRNLALGLTRAQVLEAFRIEFAVDGCVVMPAASYHLDYDVTLRVREGQVVAFVNDTAAAARLILRRGVAALEQSGLLAVNSAQTARDALAGGDMAPVLRSLTDTLKPFVNERGQVRTSLVRLFASEPTDAPVFNLQCFFAAVDVLASTEITGADAPADAHARGYLAALRDLDTAERAQHARLRELGWKVVSVPSMPDLHYSFNYLNGLQDRTSYLMPAMGGFYAPLDDAAAAAFQSALGDQVRVVRVMSEEIQQHHGGLHCSASAYPRLKGNQADQSGSVSSHPL
ncbi:MAG: agmatine deiminase family protein [Limisphaerales bacterium]